MNYKVPLIAYAPRKGARSIQTFRSMDILEFTEADLARALFITGRAEGHEYGHGRYLGGWEYRHYLALVRAYVQSDEASQDMKWTSLAMSLDPSHKAVVSYLLGQALAGIYCNRRLDVHRLLHLDRYSTTHAIASGPSVRRPDLFGYKDSLLVVVEAKGRSNASLGDIIKAGRYSANQLTSIRMVRRPGGVRWIPAILVGSVLASLRRHSSMSLYLFFPTTSEPGHFSAYGPSRIRLVTYQAGNVGNDSRNVFDVPSIDAVVHAYYRRFLSFLSTETTISTRAAAAWKIRVREMGLTVGLLSRIVDRINRVTDTGPQRLAADIDRLIAQSDIEEPGLYRDGSIFALEPPGDNEMDD